MALGGHGYDVFVATSLQVTDTRVRWTERPESTASQYLVTYLPAADASSTHVHRYAVDLIVGTLPCMEVKEQL